MSADKWEQVEAALNDYPTLNPAVLHALENLASLRDEYGEMERSISGHAQCERNMDAALAQAERERDEARTSARNFRELADTLGRERDEALAAHEQQLRNTSDSARRHKETWNKLAQAERERDEALARLGSVTQFGYEDAAALEAENERLRKAVRLKGESVRQAQDAVAALRAGNERLREALEWCVAAELDVAGNMARVGPTQKEERLAAAENGRQALTDTTEQGGPASER